ncbi:unnamed protein product [Pleuronectes platessa]|uniref:Uncharacterized protein n=1 Tax=Pleuronectes platessa TaxID=8262 RepID=A0A9N7ZCD6_PLEPL|nr:unnamed protein product [Pleuronectes platessa]
MRIDRPEPCQTDSIGGIQPLDEASILQGEDQSWTGDMPAMDGGKESLQSKVNRSQLQNIDVFATPRGYPQATHHSAFPDCSPTCEGSICRHHCPPRWNVPEGDSLEQEHPVCPWA